MIKLIASDLDETLLGPGSRVVEENLRAIKKNVRNWASNSCPLQGATFTL